MIWKNSYRNKSRKITSLIDIKLLNHFLENHSSPKDIASLFGSMTAATILPSLFILKNLGDSSGVFASKSTKDKQKLLTKVAIRQTAENLIAEILKNLKRVDVISLEKAKELYPETRNLSIGTYTLHPRSRFCLTRVEHYHKNLALEKDDELIVLLGRMGARL